MAAIFLDSVTWYRKADAGCRIPDPPAHPLPKVSAIWNLESGIWNRVRGRDEA
jgi:hypothetical protein